MFYNLPSSIFFQLTMLVVLRQSQQAYFVILEGNWGGGGKERHGRGGKGKGKVLVKRGGKRGEKSRQGNR